MKEIYRGTFRLYPSDGGWRAMSYDESWTARAKTREELKKKVDKRLRESF